MTAAPELVTYGNVTGKIYYTTLTIGDAVDLIEQASATLDQAVLIFPYFDSTEASLVALDPATGAETALYAGDGYAYARIREAAAAYQVKWTRADYYRVLVAATGVALP